MIHDPTKWWLISDEDVLEIRTFLRSVVECDDHFPATREEARDALHTLDAGLCRTDEIPEDWKENVEPDAQP